MLRFAAVWRHQLGSMVGEVNISARLLLLSADNTSSTQFETPNSSPGVRVATCDSQRPSGALRTPPCQNAPKETQLPFFSCAGRQEFDTVNVIHTVANHAS